MADAKEAKRLYMRRWRAANKERIAAHQKRYWERKAAEMEGNVREKGDAQDAGSCKTGKN